MALDNLPQLRVRYVIVEAWSSKRRNNSGGGLEMEQRFLKLYDDAAKGYKEACLTKNLHLQRTWKKRMAWIDRELAIEELYIEKEAS